MARDNAWEDQRQPIQGGGYWNTEAEYRRKGLEPPSQEGLEITEEPNWLGRLFGMRTRRFDYTTGRELGDGKMNVPPPGQRHTAGYMEPGESRDHLQTLEQRQAAGLPPDPRMGGEEELDEEEARGPGGPKMPRAVDVPNYSIWGQFLKRFSRR